MSTATGSPFTASLGWLSVTALTIATLAFLVGLLGGFSPADPTVTISARELSIVLSSAFVGVIASLFTFLLLISS